MLVFWKCEMPMPLKFRFNREKGWKRMIEPVNVAFKSSNLGVAQDVVSAAGNSSTKAGQNGSTDGMFGARTRLHVQKCRQATREKGSIQKFRHSMSETSWTWTSASFFKRKLIFAQIPSILVLSHFISPICCSLLYHWSVVHCYIMFIYQPSIKLWSDRQIDISIITHTHPP